MAKRLRAISHRPMRNRIRHRAWYRWCLCVLLIGVACGYWECTRDGGPLQMLESGQVIQVYNVDTAQLMEIDLEAYIVGVVAAEMPASFALEALKAQAVAARTFVLHRIQHPNKNVLALHAEAQISTSPATCQAWISDEERKNRWGSSYEKWHNKIVQAVVETAGEVLCYQDALIEPVYHASCGGGVTEAAEDVWGNAKPYLLSVSCNHPADKHSNVTTVVSLDEFTQKMNLPHIVTAVAMNTETVPVFVAEKTASNRIKQVTLGDWVIRGDALRRVFGLKSTLMDLQILGNEIIFTTNGYGHGAGMCQHGANYYAQQGYDYQQILRHYYAGTTVQHR